MDFKMKLALARVAREELQAQSPRYIAESLCQWTDHVVVRDSRTGRVVDTISSGSQEENLAQAQSVADKLNSDQH